MLPLFSLLASRDFSEGMALDTSQHSITKEKDKEKDLTRLDDFLPQYDLVGIKSILIKSFMM